MEFSEQLLQFAKRVDVLKDSISTEEATKTSLIMPFFSLLGYDVFDPSEFLPEFTADVGIKKGEKVDYAILQDGKPVIIIEAKSVQRNLEKHDSQLFRYFATTSAKFAILTNGIRYRFFTDLDNSNKMDELPFLDFNLLHLRSNQIEELQKFRKESFNVAKIFDSASVLKYEGKFKETIAAQFENPTDDFVRLFLQDVYSGMKTQSVIEKFRPILKASMQEYISEVMSEKFKTALAQPSAPAQPAAPAPEPEPVTAKPTAEPTALELDAFYRVQNLLQDYVRMEDITYKKNDSYFCILLQGSVRKWLCRLILNDRQLVLILPDEEKKEIRCTLANLYELGNYTRYMTSVAARYIELLQPLQPEHPKVYQIYIPRRFPKVQKKAASSSLPC
ncbi:type I restriction endonuclease [Flavonifractor hominis]|uniref:Type I restriction endonuclease n=1 Tax=Flavonifractor hominis TaxID=3133178 RepID=A0ABV1EK32_9FIRM